MVLDKNEYATQCKPYRRDGRIVGVTGQDKELFSKLVGAALNSRKFDEYMRASHVKLCIWLGRAFNGIGALFAKCFYVSTYDDVTACVFASLIFASLRAFFCPAWSFPAMAPFQPPEFISVEEEVHYIEASPEVPGIQARLRDRGQRGVISPPLKLFDCSVQRRNVAPTSTVVISSKRTHVRFTGSTTRPRRNFKRPRSKGTRLLVTSNRCAKRPSG